MRLLVVGLVLALGCGADESSCGACAAGTTCGASGRCECDDPRFAPPDCATTCSLAFSGPGCTACSPAFTGDDCERCADPRFAPPDCTTTCAREFAGDGCSACADPHFAPPVCRPGMGWSEVTLAWYRRCVDAGVCTAPDAGGNCNWQVMERDEYPVNCVDWNQAQAYCTWAGGRLPTEDEWVYAATNGQTTSEPWGDDDATCLVAVMDDRGDGCGAHRTWPVCSKPSGRTKDGLCDLAGNVWEWTATADSAGRVARGGSWCGNGALMGATARLSGPPTLRFDDLGFRCLRD